MLESKTAERAKKTQRQGKRPTTRAGGVVREEMKLVRPSKRGARSTKQVIAIGLSKARPSNVRMPIAKKAAEGKSKKSKRVMVRAERPKRAVSTGRATP